MIQLNPNKRRKDKEAREAAAKKAEGRKKTGILTKGWEKGESKLQKAGLWIKKKTGVTSKNKGIVSSAVGRFGENVEKKQTGTKKTATKSKKSTAKSRARAANVAIHGEKAISGLEAKNKDFQKMKKGGITKAQFIKKYPNSQTAKKAAKRKPRAQRGGRK